MAIPRETSTPTVLQELERDPAWAIPLAQNVTLDGVAPDTDNYVGNPKPGFGPIDSILVFCEVDLIHGPRDATLTVTVEMAATTTGPVWAEVASFDFTATDLTGGGGTNRAFFTQPNDVLRVSAYCSQKSRWRIRTVTAIPAWLDSSGPGPPATVVGDSIWDAKGDLAVGTGPDTAIRLPVGLQSQMLVVDLTTQQGLRWVNQPTGIGGDGSITASPWWRITSNGHFEWAPGNSVWDTFLFRYGVNNLVTPGLFSAAGLHGSRASNDGHEVITASWQGAGYVSWYVTTDGKMWFGDGLNNADTMLYRPSPGNLKTDATLTAGSFVTPGSLLFSPDVNLYRSGPDNLKTDDNFYAAGNIYAGGSVIVGYAAGDTYIYREAGGVLHASVHLVADQQVQSFRGAAQQVALASVGGNAGIYFHNTQDTALYRENTGWLAAPNLHLTETGIRFPDGTLQTTAPLYGLAVIARKATPRSVLNDTSEIDLLNGEFTIPAGAMATNRAVKLICWGDWYYYNGATDQDSNRAGIPQFRFKVGGTTIFDLGNGYNPYHVGEQPDWLVVRSQNHRWQWMFVITILNSSPTSQQCHLDGTLYVARDNNGGFNFEFVTGSGLFQTILAGGDGLTPYGTPLRGLGNNTTAINTASALPVQVTAALPYVGNTEMKLLGAILELV